MLSSKNLNDKSYEDMIAEAIAQIPLYSDEWTNFNPSDPGITILENLSAFMALQREQINQIPEPVRWKLLEMVGFTPRESAPAELFLKKKKNQSSCPKLPGHQKFYAQDICFELKEKQQVVENSIICAKINVQGVEIDVSTLLEHYGIPDGIAVFGETPVKGEKLYLKLDELPEDGNDLTFYVETVQSFSRTPFTKGEKNPFADITWSLYARDGYKEVAVTDETHQFMTSGIVKVHLAEQKNLQPVKIDGGYVLCAELIRADYDIPPRITMIQGLLTLAVQRDTRAVLLPYMGAGMVEVFDVLAASGLLRVYVKEQDGVYREYKRAADDEMREGRFYWSEEKSREHIFVRFDRERCGYGPIEGMKAGIIVDCRTEDMMLTENIGILYGYDDQYIDLPASHKVLPERFSIMVHKKNRGSGETCQVFYPDCGEEDAVRYHVEAEKNRIHIIDYGIHEGEEVFIGDYAVYEGSLGNVLPMTQFELKQDGRSFYFENYSQAEWGRDSEGFEELRKRFAADINQAHTLVTARDCEQMLRQVPGLSLDKVHAVTDHDRNQITIIAKPNSEYPFPKLSVIYEERIMQYLDERRILTTKIEIEQPKYMQVHVRGSFYVKKHFEHSRERIEQTLTKMLDFVAGNHTFGDIVSFHEIYHTLEQLECIDEIAELVLIPDSPMGGTVVGLDIKLKDNYICYPGRFTLELNSRQY